ncbi:CatB-related O-acetyltransferase [Falsiroseomonas sp. HC035]|uniref:CatB-related O-acetyltransferase n=1 Tax=Falsiroseomonas sp. HC035 TaxID=3390999 RepID=UPI003D315760
MNDPAIDESEPVLLLKSTIIEPYTSFFSLGNLCTMGAFSYSYSRLPVGITIGRYCSIAAHMQLFGVQHPTNRATTSVLCYDRHHLITEAALADFGSLPVICEAPQKPVPVIGNDVWIGGNVVLARGITIGDGAIIGSNSVVTKSVEPFMIVGGNPARTIRRRFSDALCEQYLRVCWWSYALPNLERLDLSRPDYFIGEIEENVACGRITKFAPEPVNAGNIISLINAA